MESVGLIQEAARSSEDGLSRRLVRPASRRRLGLYCHATPLAQPQPSLNNECGVIESRSLRRVDEVVHAGGGSNLGVGQFVTVGGTGMEWGGGMHDPPQAHSLKQDYHPEVEDEVAKKKAHACSQCGKEFASAKALFGHMSCHAPSLRFRLGLAESDQDRHQGAASAAPAYSSDNDSIEAAYVGAQAKKRKTGSSKQQQQQQHKMLRSSKNHNRRPANRIKDDKDFIADCLVMLSSSAASPPRKRTPSCASAANSSEEEEVVEWRSSARRTDSKSKGGAAAKYSCSTCKRVFKSHQALGGHRASHKKVKGCFARTSSSSSSKATTTLTTLAGGGGGEEFQGEEEDDEHEPQAGQEVRDDDQEDSQQLQLQLPPPPPARAPLHHPNPSGPNPNNNSNRSAAAAAAAAAAGHECSVCHRVFATGQALGGHKRCHWVASSADTPPGLLPRSTSNTNTNNNIHNLRLKLVKQEDMIQQSAAGEHKQPLNLDLNLPPPADDRDKFKSQEASASCDTTGNSSIQQQQFKASPPTYYNSSISSSKMI